jgi:hypothetical protein
MSTSIAAARNPQVVGIESSHEEIVQVCVQGDTAAPAVDTACNLIVRSAVMIDRPLEQQACLVLRRHRIEFFYLVLRENVRGGWCRFALEGQKLCYLPPRTPSSHR